MGLYSQYHGIGKTSLAETLKDIYPDKDWDKVLQSTDKDKVASQLKKLLKTEKDPETWIKLVDAWAKHFPHPTKGYGVAPSGHKQITKALSGPGQFNQLQKLKYWKEHGADPQEDAYIPWDQKASYDAGPYLNELKANGGLTKDPLPYHGWTPPPGVSSTYKADPTFYAAPAPSDTKTYAVPAETTGAHYQNLLERANAKKVPTRELAADELDYLSQNPSSAADVAKVKALQEKYFGHGTEFSPKKFISDYQKAFPDSPWMGSGYSAADKDTLKSEGFRNWFEKAPQAYKDTFQHNPGIALDDYDEFMKGGQAYGKPVNAQDWDSVRKEKPTSFELQHPSTTKVKEKQKVPGYVDPDDDYGGSKMWPGWTQNPEAKTTSDVGRPDEHLPEIDYDPKNPNQLEIPLPPGQKWDVHGPQKLYRGMTIHLDRHIDKYQHPRAYRLQQQIKAIVNGTSASDNPTPTLDAEQMKEMQRQMQETAKGWGASPDELARMNQSFDKPVAGTYQHPDLAHLVLEFLSLGEQEGGKGAPGLGIHWTTNERKGHDVPGSVGLDSHQSRTPSKLPVTVSADWGGAGEDPGRSGGPAASPVRKRSP